MLIKFLSSKISVGIISAVSIIFAAAEKIAENVRNEGQPAIDDFIAYLSTGSQDYPVELLKIAGADMTTSEPFEAVSRKMNYLMDELEKILEVKSLKDVEL